MDKGIGVARNDMRGKERRDIYLKREDSKQLWPPFF